ncbi:uncharacterized protein [Clytia hemisphaerica]|uniref:Uncharacterized protein n=1 Tax=Clytia hemisphaerica TaxID=252671 RepID=A0A7M5WK24_9CNID
MDKLQGKRKNLLELVDRLHVEKTVASNLEEKSEENLLEEFMNPFLLSNKKNEVYEVDPNINLKVRKQVYMLRRTRATEGGSLICELCGRSSYKQYSIEVEVSADSTTGGKRSNQWKRASTEIAKICRSCFFEQNKDQSSSKTGSKTRTRPQFHRSECGITTGRASKAWHFVRRDLIVNKTKALLNKRCFENEFSDRFLNEETEVEESCDSDTSYESDSGSIDVLPFQLANTGWVTPGSLVQVKRTDARQVVASPSPLLTEEISDALLQTELAMTRDISPRPIKSPESIKSSSDTSADDTILNALMESFETPLSIVTVAEDTADPVKTQLTNTIIEDGLLDYFTDRPARVRHIKRKRRRTISRSSVIKKKVKKDTSKQSTYNGLCKLVTVLNHTKGKYVDNSKTSTLFDTHGLDWRNKDLPSYLNINTNQYVDSKGGYRQKKKNVDAFMTDQKSKPVLKIKRKVKAFSPTPSPIPENTDQNSVIEIESDSSDSVPLATTLKEGVSDVLPKMIDLDDSMSSTSFQLKHLLDEKPSVQVKLDDISTQLASSLKEKEAKKAAVAATQKKFASVAYDCEICQQNLARKSYKSYSKETAPLIYLKLFKGNKDKLRICSNCNLRKMNEKYNVQSRKRPAGQNEKEPPAPKVSKQTPIPAKSSSSSSSMKGQTKQASSQVFKLSDAGAQDMNVTIVKSPDAEQMKMIQNSNAKYVILKATPTANGNIVTGDLDQILSEIRIQGKNYKIDKDFKLNELVKENENAGTVTANSKDLLVKQLPNILKRTIGQRNGGPTTFKIVNVMPPAMVANNTNVPKVLPKTTTQQHVTSSLPSISLQVQEQIRTSLANSKKPRTNLTGLTNSLPTNGPVKPIQMVNPPKVTLPALSDKKRPMPNTNQSVTQIQRQKIVSSTKTSSKGDSKK